MFSELALKVFRFYIQHFVKWSTPYEWKAKEEKLTISKNTPQILRWRLLSSFQMLYAIFIWIRCLQSWFLMKIPICDLILQFPSLCIFSADFFLEATIIYHGATLAFTYNQMQRNNQTLGESRTLIKWDLHGIVTSCFLIAVPLIPCIYACFFFVNRSGKNFLYSLVHSSAQSDCPGISVFLLFLAVEFLSIQAVAINGALFIYLIFSYAFHCSYWLNVWQKRNGEGLIVSNNVYMVFGIFRIHTSRFNETFSSFLLPFKDLASIFVIISVFALIGLQVKLPVGSLALMFTGSIFGSIILLFIFCPAGWVWQYSVGLKLLYNSTNAITRRKHSAMRPFGVMIGPLYVVKTHTFVTLFYIILSHIYTLLIAFKRQFLSVPSMY